MGNPNSEWAKDYPGKVVYLNEGENTCQVLFDDGVTVDRVHFSDMVPQDLTDAANYDPMFEVGASVDARVCLC